MKRLNTAPGSTLIGRKFTFYLDNTNLGKSSMQHLHYVYQIVSPGLTDKLVPLLSLENVGGKGFSILSTLLGHSKVSKGISLLRSFFYKDDVVFQYPKEDEFPAFEMIEGNSLQKTIIMGLRDLMRWKKYKFFIGNKIDLLFSLDKVLLAEVVSGPTAESIMLKPISLHYKEDIEFKNPIEGIDIDNIDCLTGSFKGKSSFSELNREIKKFEWKCFDRTQSSYYKN